MHPILYNSYSLLIAQLSVYIFAHMFECFVCTLFLLNQNIFTDCAAECHPYVRHFIYSCSANNCAICTVKYDSQENQELL